MDQIFANKAVKNQLQKLWDAPWMMKIDGKEVEIKIESEDKIKITKVEKLLRIQLETNTKETAFNLLENEITADYKLKSDYMELFIY